MLPADGSSNALIIGIIAFIGSQVIVTLGVAMATWRFLRAAVREDITLWAFDDTSPFGKHRTDPEAHTALQRQMMAEFQADIEKTNAEHRQIMTDFMALMRPIIEQNGEALRVMATQMRRQVKSED